MWSDESSPAEAETANAMDSAFTSATPRQATDRQYWSMNAERHGARRDPGGGIENVTESGAP